MFERCHVMRPGEIVRLFAAALLIGMAGGAAILETYQELAVTLGPPVIEHDSYAYGIVRIPVRVLSREMSCRLVLYHDRGTWSIQC